MRYNKNNIREDDLLDYIYHELSENNEQEMEDFLDEHPFYADTVDNLLQIIQTKKFDRKSLKKWLDEEHAKVTIPKRDPEDISSPKRNNNKSLWIIIGLILIAIIIATFIYTQSPSIEDKIFTDEFSLKTADEYLDNNGKLIISQTSSELTGEDAEKLGVALLFYQQKKYDEAEQKLNNIINKNDEIPEAYLYRGMIYTEQNKSDKAISDFENARMLSGTDTELLEESIFNIALLKLKVGSQTSIEEAKEILEQLKNSSYRQKANEILGKLRDN